MILSPSSQIHVVPLLPEYAAQAAFWATRLHLPLLPQPSPPHPADHRCTAPSSSRLVGPVEAAGVQLQVGAEGLQLYLPPSGTDGTRTSGLIRVDFLSGTVAHRRHFGGGSGQMIAKAVGIQPGLRPTVLDATAGLGRDAFVLAQLGCPLRLIERQPLIAALLEDGLRRASENAELAAIVARMSLIVGDAITLMRDWRHGHGDSHSDSAPPDIPQVIYLDPMFPPRRKSALVKKEMRLLRPLAGDDRDASALLAAALDLASHRVVVKRPRQAPPLDGQPPGYTLHGQSSRFDIYPKKSLKSA